VSVATGISWMKKQARNDFLWNIKFDLRL